MKYALISLLFAWASPVVAEQPVRIAPAEFQVRADPALGVCVATDHLLSARKAGMDVAFVLRQDQQVEMILAPDGYARTGRLPQILEFGFPDSMTLRSAATLKNGRFLIELYADGKSSPLWIALRGQSRTIVTLPLRPIDRIGLDLSQMAAVYAQLQTCVRGLAQ